MGRYCTGFIAKNAPDTTVHQAPDSNDGRPYAVHSTIGRCSSGSHKVLVRTDMTTTSDTKIPVSGRRPTTAMTGRMIHGGTDAR